MKVLLLLLLLSSSISCLWSGFEGIEGYLGNHKDYKHNTKDEKILYPIQPTHLYEIDCKKLIYETCSIDIKKIKEFMLCDKISDKIINCSILSNKNTSYNHNISCKLAEDLFYSYTESIVKKVYNISIVDDQSNNSNTKKHETSMTKRQLFNKNMIIIVSIGIIFFLYMVTVIHYDITF